jgi:hypothetical protein
MSKVCLKEAIGADEQFVILTIELGLFFILFMSIIFTELLFESLFGLSLLEQPLLLQMLVLSVHHVEQNEVSGKVRCRVVVEADFVKWALLVILFDETNYAALAERVPASQVDWNSILSIEADCADRTAEKRLHLLIYQ